MIKSNKIILNLTSILSIISVFSLIYIILALVVYKQQVFIELGTISNMEILIIIAFVLYLQFNIVPFFPTFKEI